MKTEDVIGFMREWKDEIVKLKDDYHQDILIMKTAREEMLAREKLPPKTPWLKYVLLAVFGLCLLTCVIIFAFNPDWCTLGIEASGFKIGILRDSLTCSQ